jgi:hypothetical protein
MENRDIRTEDQETGSYTLEGWVSCLFFSRVSNQVQPVWVVKLENKVKAIFCGDFIIWELCKGQPT